MKSAERGVLFERGDCYIKKEILLHDIAILFCIPRRLLIAHGIIATRDI